jgi:hypothetical protein
MEFIGCLEWVQDSTPKTAFVLYLFLSSVTIKKPFFENVPPVKRQCYSFKIPGLNDYARDLHAKFPKNQPIIMNLQACTREHHFYVAIAKHVFLHTEKGIVFVSEPIRLKDAEKLNLKPLLFVQTSFHWVATSRFAYCINRFCI